MQSPPPSPRKPTNPWPLVVGGIALGVTLLSIPLLLIVWVWRAFFVDAGSIPPPPSAPGFSSGSGVLPPKGPSPVQVRLNRFETRSTGTQPIPGYGGKVVLVCNVTVTNVASHRVGLAPSEFRLVASDRQVYGDATMALAMAGMGSGPGAIQEQDAVLEGDLLPGGQATGHLFFLVQPGAQPVSFEFDDWTEGGTR